MAKCISLDRNEAKPRTKRQSDGGIRRRATWIVVQDIQNTACWRRFSELNASLLPSRHYSKSLSRSSVSEEPAARNQASPSPTEEIEAEQKWRYDGAYVWTGESMVYAPRLAGRMCAAGLRRESGSRMAQVLSAKPPFITTTSSSPSHRAPKSKTKNKTSIFASSSSSSSSPPPPPPQPPQPLSDAALILLYKWKVIKKKGVCDFLRFFPGHTRESLGVVWRRDQGRARALVEREREGEGEGEEKEKGKGKGKEKMGQRKEKGARGLK